MTHKRRRCRSGDRCEPRTLGEAIACVVLHSNADAQLIAERVGVRYGYLLDAANPDREEIQFQARLILPVSDAAHNDGIVEFLCRQRGGVFVRVPTAHLDGAEALTRAHLDVVREMGEDAAKMQRILEDGRLTVEEADAFDVEADETIQKIARWKAIVRAHVGKDLR